MADIIVSDATINNWKRLNVSEDELSDRLSRRANKLYSTKKFIPKEYLKNKKNISKIEELLSLENDCNKLIYNLALNLLSKNNLIQIKKTLNSENKYLIEILNDFGEYEISEKILSYELPDEDDILGIVYQSMMKEGNKNKKGSYYTPPQIIENFIPLIKENTKFLDPCCGTGSFLLKLGDKIKNPKNIHGIDYDKTACFIAKINLIIKYKHLEFAPNIYNCDFLTFESNQIFDVIATNPPWGATYETDYSQAFPEIKSKEGFSYFIAKSESMVTKNGKCCFILPVSVINVKTHKDIRKFILDNFHIEEISLYGKPFSNVMSDVIGIILSKEKTDSDIRIADKKEKFVSQSVYIKNKNYNFNLIDNKDAELLDYLFSQPHTTLQNSTWGLGIVTGNNSKYIHTEKNYGEPIYTGKDISKYLLKTNRNYIKYDRNLYQQVAPEEIYRAEEKLVYKFISDSLTFAYDNKKSLVLNSANILIPSVETHSIKTTLAFLNSKIFQYIYKTKFNEIKILRGNLEQLPFPYLNNTTKSELEKYVDLYINTQNSKALNNIEQIISKVFLLSDNDYSMLLSSLYSS